jgi:hypothetical protein
MILHPIVVIVGMVERWRALRSFCGNFNARCVDRLRRFWRVPFFVLFTHRGLSIIFTPDVNVVCCGSDHTILSTCRWSCWIGSSHLALSLLFPARKTLLSYTNTYRHMQSWTFPERGYLAYFYISMDSYHSSFSFCLSTYDCHAPIDIIYLQLHLLQINSSFFFALIRLQ